MIALLDELEEGIEALRVAYEKYFLGVERTPPVREREKIEKRLRSLEALHVQSTALRFRLGGLRARFITYKHYWTRIEGEMERGVYRRDLQRLTRRRPPPETPAAEGAPSPTPALEAAPTAPRTRPTFDPAAVGLDPDHLEHVFRELVRAKRAAGEGLEGLTYGALVRKLVREAPKVRAKHKCEKVRFEVATVDGKVRLRARPA